MLNLMVLGIHKIDPFLSLVIPLLFNYNNWILFFNKNKIKPIARHRQLGNAYPIRGIAVCLSFEPTPSWSSARQPFVCMPIAAPVSRKVSALSRTKLLMPFLYSLSNQWKQSASTNHICWTIQISPKENALLSK